MSICIPVYNRVHYLPRLLESILNQTFTDFEIVVSDNSDDDRMVELLQQYRNRVSISYRRNIPAVNMTENWLRSFELASGSWIKLIHDDDWFTSNDALAKFVANIEAGKRFVFSGHCKYFEDTEVTEDHIISNRSFEKICKKPEYLFSGNLFGSPSTLMFHKSVTEQYDTFLKWYVDMEYYYRILKMEQVTYIPETLVTICHNDTQVTNFTRTNPSVVIPELLHILNKHKNKLSKDIVVYDTWWRIFRNLNVNSLEKIEPYARKMTIPPFINQMLLHQQKIPIRVLKNSYFSKLFMLASYLMNAKK